jgi:uncharacterized membrane protein
MSDAVVFDALLKPNPPMKPKALLIVLAIVAAMNIAFAGYFLARGAWPVTPFMGLDVLLLAWAFRASSVAARRFERVTLTPDQLTVLRQPPKGAGDAVKFNPYWVRVDLEQLTEHSNRLYVRSHGRELQVGSFLAPDLRKSFAAKLKDALGTVRDYRGAYFL